MIEILPLSDRRGCIEQLAQWQFAQWGPFNPANTIDRRIDRLHGHLESGRVPQTFVAFDGERLLGSASIVAADLPSRDDLSPWLASVYVDPPFRNRGIGAALVKRVAQEARALGFPTIYLFTPDRAAFYANLGWQTVELADWNGLQVTVMELPLHSKP
jgi:GNAT superfamily N-acetyltransferase